MEGQPPGLTLRRLREIDNPCDRRVTKIVRVVPEPPWSGEDAVPYLQCRRVSFLVSFELMLKPSLVWTHLSTGDLLRAERVAGGPTAPIIEEFVSAGKLVPNEITVTLLKSAMERISRTTGKKNFLLDGFPRSLDNLEAWFPDYQIFITTYDKPWFE